MEEVYSLYGLDAKLAVFYAVYLDNAGVDQMWIGAIFIGVFILSVSCRVQPIPGEIKKNSGEIRVKNPGARKSQFQIGKH